MPLSPVIDEPTTARATNTYQLRFGRDIASRCVGADRYLLDLNMAVRADQHALVEFLTDRLPAASVAAGDRELLCARINVVEVQGSQTARITAKVACATLVLDHATLCLDTVDAAIGAAGVALQLRVTTTVVMEVAPPADAASA